MRTFISLIIVSALLMPVGSLAADTAPAAASNEVPSPEDKLPFYATWEKPGWWWGKYKSEDKPEESKPEKKDNKTPSIPPPLSHYKYRELWNLHPDVFQALLMDYQKKAVRDPSEDNVRDYYIMQDIARRKARDFANVAQLVWQSNPELNVSKDYPASPIGIMARTQQQTSDKESKIRSNKDVFALLFFYSDTCPYCIQESSVLKFFVDKYDWPIKEIDINKQLVVASRFNIANVPTILLIQRDSSNYQLVTSGFSTLDEIEENIYRSIRLMNREITPGQFSQYDFQDRSSFNPTGLMESGDDFINNRKEAPNADYR